MPHGGATRRAPQERKSILQVAEHFRWSEHAGACCCQLDREREAIQSTTQLQYGWHVLGERTSVVRSSTFDEQLHGFFSFEGFETPHELTLNTERLAAGCDHLHTAAVSAQSQNQVGAAGDEVLAIVQDEQ